MFGHEALLLSQLRLLLHLQRLELLGQRHLCLGVGRRVPRDAVLQEVDENPWHT